MSNQKELLKLEYENHRTYAFAEFTAILLIAFGILSNFNILTKNYISVLVILTITFILLLIGFWISFGAMRRTFEKLKNILIEDYPISKKIDKKH